MRYRRLVPLLLALLALILAVISLMIQPAHAQAKSTCGAPHRASGKFSLFHIGDYYGPAEGVARILMATQRCNGVYPPFLWYYINAGDLHAKLYKGTRFWTHT